jgi:hypothetical protein
MNVFDDLGDDIDTLETRLAAAKIVYGITYGGRQV